MQNVVTRHDFDDTVDAEKASVRRRKKVRSSQKEEMVIEKVKNDKGKEKKNASKARLLAKDDVGLFGIGSLGAILSGLMFPGE